MPDEHAKFSPSAADRWLTCPRSVRPNEPDPPERDTVATVKGTAMHNEAERWLKTGKEPAKGPLYFTNPETGNKDSIPWADWHDKHVAPYVAAVRQAVEDLGPKAELFIEERLFIDGDDCWGTADAVVVGPQEVMIIDLKTGGKVVDPSCPQFRTYAVGAMNRWPKLRYTVARFQAEASEPWAQVSYEVQDLEDHLVLIQEAIAASYKAARGNEVEGPHCLWCPYKDSCCVHIDRALACLPDDLDDDKKALEFPRLEELDEDKRRWLLFHGEAIREWLKDLKAAEIAKAAETGEAPEGWKLVEGRSVRKWNPDLADTELASEIAEAADMLEVELDPWERKVISFTTVEKALGRGSVDHLTVKPEGKPTLVRDDDNRPSLGIASLRALGELNDD